MIGQKRLLDELNGLINEDKLPRFIIIIGDRGSQSDEIAPFIAGLMCANYVRLLDVKVDTIRNMIDEAYRFSEITIYNIADADNMSPQSRNALLKVCEEPPNNAYFIMTLYDIGNTLNTIKSRATIFYMDKYSKDELSGYYDSKKYSGDKELVVTLAETPGDVDILVSNVKEFYEYANGFIDNVTKVSGAEAFNLTNKVSIKDGDDRFDIILFFKIFQHICIERASESKKAELISKYCWSVIHAGFCIQDIVRKKGINRQMLLDDFVLELRKAWK